MQLFNTSEEMLLNILQFGTHLQKQGKSEMK